ncbi:glycosyltransferase family 2 protein [Clostridium sp.]|uniref:glycosyltransferase family 2 protein n=1 Tax=Clostridium sp. TaxID=1506 RepID=UPI002FCA15D9
MDYFDVPVVVFFFKREEKTIKVIERISEIKPKRLYLISDGPRNDEEATRVRICRELVEAAITWNCEIIKNYAEENKGVYDRIGLGAKWVLSREEYAIFLEDDNLPNKSFFWFCREMLVKYKNDSRILWICGTNYLGKYQPEDQSSYVFTKHMLPCGWASWANKFSKYYDGDMKLWDNTYVRKRVLKEFSYRPLAKQMYSLWEGMYRKIKSGEKPGTWDHQMSFTQRSQNLFAVVPKFNLIENIGVDLDSEHGGTSYKNKMTQRFCGIPTFELEFPLTHPQGFFIDKKFEAKNDKIICLPISYRIKGSIIMLIKKAFGMDVYMSFKQQFNVKK